MVSHLVILVLILFKHHGEPYDFCFFAINTYSVSLSYYSAGGTISPNTVQTVDYNSTKSFVITPNAGYKAQVGGSCGGVQSP